MAELREPDSISNASSHEQWRGDKIDAFASTFFENLPGLVWLKDAEGRYLYANSLALEAFQRTAEDLYGRTDVEIFPDATARQFQANDRLALHSSCPVRVTETLEHPDGSVHYSLVSKFPVKDPGGRAYIGGIAMDITEQRRVEEKLRAVLASIGDHLVCYDRNWRFTHVNDAAALVLGKSKEELLGACIWELFPDAVGNEYYTEVHRALDEQRIVRFEHYYEPYDKWFENHIYPSPDGVTVFAYDITWRKKMEEEVARRSDALREADRRKDEFLATLSHELRNPLAPLSNALQLMQLTRGDLSAFDRTREIMERQVAQLSRLIDDLLDVSRITRDKLELRIQRMDLVDALKSAVEACMPLIEALGHKLKINAPKAPVLVHADSARLSQVFTNLLGNAVRYTPEGGNIRVTVTPLEDRVAVSIRDSGIGISPENLGEVFEIFVQLDRTGAGAQQGLGLGLTLAKRLVDLHGGTLDARSDGPGKGSEFTVTLPTAGPSQPLTVLPGPNAALAPRSLRVLIVDDNVDAAQTLSMLLTSQGHECRLAHEGIDALRLASEFQPEVALLDIGLPGLSGYEISRQIRKQEWGASALLIAITGWGQDSDRKRALQAGFNHHLTKPVDHQRLHQILSGLLSA